MGLLDGNLLGGIDPTDPRVALAAGLLGGRGNFGANLGQGLMGAQQSAQAQKQFALTEQNAERANRANDLQQVSGLYSLLKQQEFARMLQARQSGQPYTPNPMLGQLEQKMATLAGAPPLGGATALPLGGGASSPAPQMPSPQVGAPPPSAAPPQGQAQAPMQPAQPQQDSGPLGGPAFGIPMEAYLAQDPTGKAYMAALEKQANPISTRYGVYTLNPKNPSQVQLAGGMIPQNALPIQMGPGGPSIAPLPGQTDTVKALVNAQEAGKAPYDIKMVENASGARVPMSVAQLAGGPQASPQIPPAVQAAANRGQPFEATQVPGGPVQFNPNPRGTPKAQDIFASAPDMPQPPPGLGQSSYQKAVAERQADAYAKTAAEVSAEASTANQRVAYNNAALQALPQATTGSLAQQLQGVQNFLVTRFGVPEKLFSPTSTAELNKYLINAATQRARQIYGPRLAQGEVMLQINQASPSLGMTKAAIQALLDMDNRIAGYSIQKASDFQQYMARGKDPMLFDGWYARAKPMANEVDLNSAPAPQGFKVLGKE